jgi:hypothetical protein
VRDKEQAQLVRVDLPPLKLFAGARRQPRHGVARTHLELRIDLALN